MLQLDYSQRSSNFERTDYYHQRGLIPPQFEKELGGLNASITIVNYQQFLARVFAGKHASPLDGKQKWVNGELVTQKEKETSLPSVSSSSRSVMQACSQMTGDT